MDLTTLPAGPEVLGIDLAADAHVADGWLVCEFLAPPGLDGPPGILQGGLSAALAITVARAADRFGAPATSVDARLHAPTPLGRTLQARVRATDVVARYEVETHDGDTLLVSAEVELAGQDPSPKVYDLAELAGVALPEPEPQHEFPTCIVCGPDATHPAAQFLHPRYHPPASTVIPWVADEELGDHRGVIDPLMISAVLDCPGVWAARDTIHALGHTGALLAGYHLRLFRDAPVMEPMRTVGRLDEADGRKLHTRGALVDDDGVVYASVAALHISVPEVPSLVPDDPSA